MFIVNHQIKVSVSTSKKGSKIETLIDVPIDFHASESEKNDIKEEAAIDWMIRNVKMEWEDK